MENNASDKNLWQQMHVEDQSKKQFYATYQPMQHSFDLQSDVNRTLPKGNDISHFDIYLNERSNFFERTRFEQSDPVFINNIDVFNNYLSNAQNSGSTSFQIENPNSKKNSSVIHHLVASNLGPGKFGTFGSNDTDSFNTITSSTNSAPINLSPPTHSDYAKDSSVLEKNRSDSICSKTIPMLINRKPRMVAEVKPMRMSYSDVVSKTGFETNSQNNSCASSVGPPRSSPSSSPNTTLPARNIKYEKFKHASNNHDKKQQDVDKNRKSPININAATSNVEIKKHSSTINSIKMEKNYLHHHQQLQNVKSRRKFQTKDELFHGSQLPSNENPNTDGKTQHCITDSEPSSVIESEEEDHCMEYYNVRKNVYQGEHHKVEKIKISVGYRKNKQTSNIISRKIEKNKRGNGKLVGRKHKHEFLQKLFASGFEFLCVFIKWLWMLVYDVGYLSFGIIYDRVCWGYQNVRQKIAYIRKELHGKFFLNWINNSWKKFDKMFDKKSKWAFWRYLFKKQANNEHFYDCYKDGKLPKTAEEAMKSLLNCKEKDAYSILGVSPDCPQEQIKKHYKKIAVLVHPDKNKQAGAEEAFKVLQRSFELIGELESRKLYDENLAKALHTEKAFSELNDLLIQLQTKISEAANTIRCSSCCFRHPRRPTGRKPFAARECSSCKIRHSAREGDIWAETSLFGLRWKYLALMEGNVYDITEWALCQRGALSHLQANSCVVQYKIVLGGNHQHNHAPEKDRMKKESPVNEKMEDFFMNNIYAGQKNSGKGNRRNKK